MVPTFSEVYTWTNDEIVGHIRNVIPSNWTFRHVHAGLISASIEDEDGIIQWEDEQIDERLLLLNAFGWLMAKDAKISNPLWKRGSGPPFQVRSSAITFTEELADLDPESVGSVYEENANRRSS